MKILLKKPIAKALMNKTTTGLTAPSRILKSWGIPLFIAILAIFAYLNGINGEFIFDDIPLVMTDPFYTDADTSWLDCWNRCYWRKELAIGQHRPLTLLSFLINTRITGMYSPAFRLINLILHTIITLLVFQLAVKLKLGRIFAIFAALLFAVHPLHSEAVIPTSGRAELLCALFIILGLIFHICSYKKASILNLSGEAWKVKTDALCSMLTALCLLLACWSKENGVILLPLCLLYDLFYKIKLNSFCYIGKSDPASFCELRRTSKCDFDCPISLFIKKYWGMFLALLIAITTRVIGIGMLLPKLKTGTDLSVDNPLIGAPILTRILTAFHVQGMVIVKFFWPQVLAHDYSYAQILPVNTMLDPYVSSPIFCFFILPVILCLLIPERKKMILFLWGAYLISILPAGNFITPTGTIFGERLYYTPSVWLIFITLYLLFIITKKISLKVNNARTALFGILIIAIFTSIFRIYMRAEDLRNTWNLALSAVRFSPKSIKTWQNLARELGQKDKYENAVAACDIGLSILPDDKGLLKNRIYYLVALKRYQEAEKDLYKIKKLGTRDPEMYNLLAGIAIRKGNLKEAQKLLETSLLLKPDQKRIRINLEQVIQDINLKNSN